jgi:uncharacterized protein
VNEAARQAQVERDSETGGEAETPDAAPVPGSPVTLEEVQQDRRLSGLIAGADRVMEGLGFTEHGFRHATLVARIAFNVLDRLGFDERTTTLACVAGYLHDIGNSVARENHGPTGALFAYDALKDRMRMEDLTPVLAAIGNHEEEYGQAVSPISAAVILADKSDVHRSRVRKSGQPDFDIHDRVNYAAEQSFLRVDSSARTVTLELTIDTEISQVMEYFEIFLHRMVMCRRAAERLDCQFKITANGVTLL